MAFDYQEMSAPFFLKGASNKAALLIHGFLVSPYIMRSMAKCLNAAGYTVQGITLPGHGTQHQDLQHVTYSQWQNSVDEALQELQKSYAEVIIVGFSLGSILGLIAAFKFKVEQLILISPAFKITPLAQIVKFLSLVSLDRFLPMLFCTQSEKENFGSYQEFPPHAVAQVQKALDQYYRLLPQQKALPKVYVASSVEDSTVAFTGVLAAMRTYPQDSHFRIYTQDKVKLPRALPNNVSVIEAGQFERIQAFSHVSLPVAPEDAYFGIKGAYYASLTEDITFAEPTWRDKKKPIKRLTYNPDFANMSQDILSWLHADSIKVVIGIILNAAGEFCLAERPAHVHLGGLWEFPGGKLEAGEDPLTGLSRELHEELGIRIIEASPFMRFPYHYPQCRVELDFWLVDAFEGEVHGKEGQKVMWVKQENLAEYRVPEASRPVINALLKTAAESASIQK